MSNFANSRLKAAVLLSTQTLPTETLRWRSAGWSGRRAGFISLPMTLHPQIAAFAAQLDDLSRLLRAQGARPWADRIDLIQRAVADSNYAGVTRFLEMFDGEGGFAELTLSDEAADAALSECRAAALAMAQRLAREEG